jgi:hypothetical protein
MSTRIDLDLDRRAERLAEEIEQSGRDPLIELVVLRRAALILQLRHSPSPPAGARRARIEASCALPDLEDAEGE